MALFSLKHFLVLSMALNVSLILRVLHITEKQSPVSLNRTPVVEEGKAQSEPEVSQRSLLAVTPTPTSKSSDGVPVEDVEEKVINLDHGDPTMYEKYWQQQGDKATIVIPGWQTMSYFSDVKNLCWFLEPEFAKQVVRLHNVVGNAVTEGRHIVVGTGSSQLFLAALFALSPNNASDPINVVSASPYYSSYPTMADYLKSGLYRWAGDARSYTKEGPYIEVVTSPNNPDGNVRHSMVNRTGGLLIHDLAYYWPQYTPISSPTNNDLTLFTVSKATGHAGTRIGWALVKDAEVAKKMIKFIELNTIGVSKDSQLRAARIIKVIADSCDQSGSSEFSESFFQSSYHLIAERWQLLRESVNASGLFSLPQFSSGFCHFLQQVSKPQPAFAWLKCEKEIEDCQSFLRGLKILTRGGTNFGVGPKYVRISMVDRDENFKIFLKRLSTVHL